MEYIQINTQIIAASQFETFLQNNRYGLKILVTDTLNGHGKAIEWMRFIIYEYSEVNENMKNGENLLSVSANQREKWVKIRLKWICPLSRGVR